MGELGGVTHRTERFMAAPEAAIQPDKQKTLSA